MVDKGRWIVRKRPDTAAFSSSAGGLDRRSAACADVEFRGVASAELVVASLAEMEMPGGDRPRFEDSDDGGGGERDWCDRDCDCDCFSSRSLRAVISETAASTFLSNSASETVRFVRSRFSMNWTAPSCYNRCVVSFCLQF